MWWSPLSQDHFFPKCYNLTDFKELDEFKEDFRVIKAESILKKYVKKKESAEIERIFVCLYISEKRLMDTDSYIDDPDLENLVTDNEWKVIESLQGNSEDFRANLREQDWFRTIFLKYQHLC